MCEGQSGSQGRLGAQTRAPVHKKEKKACVRKVLDFSAVLTRFDKQVENL